MFSASTSTNVACSCERADADRVGAQARVTGDADEVEVELACDFDLRSPRTASATAGDEPRSHAWSLAAKRQLATRSRHAARRGPVPSYMWMQSRTF